jgi:diguanylate cyclase (GGDEF)-like protein/PAS domain S-box-containing protein
MTKELSVLVVDDSEDDQSLCRRALRATGVRLVPALTGEKGLRKIDEVQPDIVLLDYNLPDMDGLEFLQRLADRGCTSLPVVMFTGKGSEEIAVEAMKAGATDYLVKDTEGGHLRLLPSVINRSLAAHEGQMRARRLGALHEAILGTAAEGIVGVDTDGKILFANPAAERLLLVPPNELHGRRLNEFLRQEDPRAEWSGHPLAQAHGSSTTVFRDCDFFQRQGGTSFPAAYTASPLDFEGNGRFGWVVIFHDVTEQKQAEEELIKTARYDPLTGLPNRLMFQDYFAKYLSRVTRHVHHLALLFIDLDGFKEVNDSFGHLTGDQLLQLVAQRLVQCVRGGDLVSRFGGDEFTVILDECDPEQLASLSERIVRDIGAPYNLNGRVARITASIGIALYPECGTDEHTLIQKADAAMYVAKRSGKNGFRFCSDLPLLFPE